MRTRLTLCLLLLAITLPGSSAFAQVLPRSVEIGTLTSFYSFIDRGGFGQDKTVKLENIEDGLTLGARFGVNFTEVFGFETSFGILQGRTDDSNRRVCTETFTSTVSSTSPSPTSSLLPSGQASSTTTSAPPTPLERALRTLTALIATPIRTTHASCPRTASTSRIALPTATSSSTLGAGPSSSSIRIATRVLADDRSPPRPSLQVSVGPADARRCPDTRDNG